MAEILHAGYVPQHRYGASIGQPLTRRDGLLKVTGQARYAADNHPPGMLHAALAVSSIARGRVTFLDVAAAKAHPGVVEVMTTPGCAFAVVTSRKVTRPRAMLLIARAAYSMPGGWLSAA